MNNILNKITALKTNWKNGVPTKIIYSTSKDSNYKVRKAWFHLVGSVLNDICKQSHQKQIKISPQLLLEIINYRDVLFNEISLKDLITQKDIDRAEEILDLIIDELK